MRACWLKWVGRDWSISADYIWLKKSDANRRTLPCGLRFRLSPHSFYQVNREQAERLYALAAEAAAL